MGGGGLLLAFWYLYVALMPYRQITDSLSLLALHPRWVLVNLIGVARARLALLGLPGLLPRHGGEVLPPLRGRPGEADGPRSLRPRLRA